MAYVVFFRLPPTCKCRLFSLITDELDSKIAKIRMTNVVYRGAEKHGPSSFRVIRSYSSWRTDRDASSPPGQTITPWPNNHPSPSLSFSPSSPSRLLPYTSPTLLHWHIPILLLSRISCLLHRTSARHQPLAARATTSRPRDLVALLPRQLQPHPRRNEPRRGRSRREELPARYPRLPNPRQRRRRCQFHTKRRAKAGKIKTLPT